jgi:alkylation response protein AidB-like acyl-CoA dehydrogenase
MGQGAAVHALGRAAPPADSPGRVPRIVDAVHPHDPAGSMRGVRIGRAFRDAGIARIHQGTNPIQGMIMARELFW